MGGDTTPQTKKMKPIKKMNKTTNGEINISFPNKFKFPLASIGSLFIQVGH